MLSKLIAKDSTLLNLNPVEIDKVIKNFLIIILALKEV